MSHSDDGNSHLDEEIRQSTNNLERVRKLRKLRQLELQIAKENELLQEAEERLKNARRGVGSGASAPYSDKLSVVCNPSAVSEWPAFSVASGQDTSSAVDAFMDSVLHSSGENMVTRSCNMWGNNRVFAAGSKPSNYQWGQLEGDPPATQQYHTSETKTATSPPVLARMTEGEVKRESQAPTLRSNNGLVGSVPLKRHLYGGPCEEDTNAETKTLPSQRRHSLENTTDTSPTLRPSTQAALSWNPIQSIPAHRIPATPPNSPALKLGTYEGIRWAECIHYIKTLEAHFTQYPTYYTEVSKVELGAKYISPALIDGWHSHIMTPGSMTWMSFCTFLAQQLSRNASHRQALEGIANAFQKVAQPVAHFALWLIQWAPVAPDVSSQEFMAALLKGVLPDIRDRAQKSYEQFSDYNSFAMYLQEVENLTPSRANTRPKGRNSTVPANALLLQEDRNENKWECRETFPSESLKCPSNQVDRGPLPEVLALRDLLPYSARNWQECKTFMLRLQNYFDNDGSQFNEARKIEIGRSKLSPSLLEKWDESAAHLEAPTWFAFCVFLVDQSPSQNAGNAKYTNTYQRDNQPVCSFALELLRWAPANFSAAHNRLRHLWDRVLPEIRSDAKNSWEVYTEFHIFVADLQQVQDTSSIQRPGRDLHKQPPRKRYRRNGSS